MSPRVLAVAERYTAVTRALVRLGMGKLINGCVQEAELIRTLERLADGAGFNEIETRSIAHVAEHPHAYIMYCRRNPQRLAEMISQKENPRPPHTERGLLMPIDMQGPTDNDQGTRLCE